MTSSVVFMGSPDFALPILRSLAEHYTVVGVITQPDKPAGRGRTLTPPPVKSLALSLGLPVFQPERLRRPEAMDQLAAWAPDLIVVAAYGQILRPNVLDLPKFGCINVHASLLPRWRGAAPVQAALLHGDPVTGATIMKMDPGIDTGPTLASVSTPILPDDNAGSLTERLAVLGAQLLVDTLPAYLSGKLQPVPQEETGALYAPMIKKEEGMLDFQQTGERLVNRVRAFTPWPGAYFDWQGQPLKVLRARPVYESTQTAPGMRWVKDRLPAIAVSDGWLCLEEVQPSGKRPMSGQDFLRGARGWMEP